MIAIPHADDCGSLQIALDQRYSIVWALALAIDTQLQTNPGAPPASTPDGGNIIVHPEDKTVPRYRPLVIISEQGYGAPDILKRRAEWEIARRYGRSQAVTLTTDTWRDSEGVVWAPNTLAVLDIPELHLGNMQWLISEVTFSSDLGRGTVADITLMPPEAFKPQLPTSLVDGQLMEAMREAAPSPPVSTFGMQGRA